MKVAFAIFLVLSQINGTTGLLNKWSSLKTKWEPSKSSAPFTKYDAKLRSQGWLRVASHSKSQQISMTNRCDEYAELLRKPRWGGPILGEIVRFMNTIFIVSVSMLILKVFNRFKVLRKDILNNLITNREKGRGMLTVSNHQSVLDDPGLLSCFVPVHRFFFRSDQLRWVLCTEDVFFAVSFLLFLLVISAAANR
jgi:hypothetical protein